MTKKTAKLSAFTIRKAKKVAFRNKPTIYIQGTYRSAVTVLQVPKKNLQVKESLSGRNLSPFKNSSIRPIDFSKYESLSKSSSKIRITVNSTLRIFEFGQHQQEGGLRHMPQP